MRSTRSQPGEPWPHDMQITIDHPSSLVFLLFVRDAWRLPIDDLPRLDPRPTVGGSARPPSIDVQEGTARWLEEWGRAWSRFDPVDRTVREPDAATTRLLELSDEELVEAITEMPSAFWADGIDQAAFDEWRFALEDDHSLPLEQHPERVCLDALIPAWRSGLDMVIQLPYLGYFAERRSRNTLVVSRATRSTPALYRKALGVALSDGK